MTQTKFFTRSSDNLEVYKKNFKEALKKAKIVKLFSNKVLDFFEKWIELQKNYIPREDIDNFLDNLNYIYKNKDFYDFVVLELKKVIDNGKIQEYSFNLISKLDEASKTFKEIEKKKEFEKKLEKDKLNSKKQDEEEMEKILMGL